MLLAAIAGAGILGWLAGRLLRTDGQPGWPVGALSREEYWRRTLPWPRGVQEDDGIAWHVPRDEPAEAPQSGGRAQSVGRPIPPTQPQRRFIGR
jgi:hypothetical protein